MTGNFSSKNGKDSLHSHDKMSTACIEASVAASSNLYKYSYSLDRQVTHIYIVEDLNMIKTSICI